MGVHGISYFCSKHRLWTLVRREYLIFNLKIATFTAIKSSILNTRVNFMRLGSMLTSSASKKAFCNEVNSEARVILSLL